MYLCAHSQKHAYWYTAGTFQFLRPLKDENYIIYYTRPDTYLSFYQPSPLQTDSITKIVGDNKWTVLLCQYKDFDKVYWFRTVNDISRSLAEIFFLFDLLLLEETRQKETDMYFWYCFAKREDVERIEKQ